MNYRIISKVLMDNFQANKAITRGYILVNEDGEYGFVPFDNTVSLFMNSNIEGVTFDGNDFSFDNIDNSLLPIVNYFYSIGTTNIPTYTVTNNWDDTYKIVGKNGIFIKTLTEIKTAVANKTCMLVNGVITKNKIEYKTTASVIGILKRGDEVLVNMLLPNGQSRLFKESSISNIVVNKLGCKLFNAKIVNNALVSKDGQFIVIKSNKTKGINIESKPVTNTQLNIKASTIIGVEVPKACVTQTPIFKDDLKFNIPDNIMFIHRNAFRTYKHLAVNLNKIKKLYFIDDYAFCQAEFAKGYTDLKFSGVHIGIRAFEKSNITSLEIQNDCCIKGEAFKDNALKSLIIEPNVKLEEGAFCNNLQLETVEIRGTANIPKKCFEYCGITDLTIADGTQIIEEKAFADCCKLKEVRLPKTISFIHPKAFESSHIEKLVVPSHLRGQAEVLEGVKSIEYYESEVELIKKKFTIFGDNSYVDLVGNVFYVKDGRASVVKYVGPIVAFPEGIVELYKTRDIEKVACRLPDTLKQIEHNTFSGTEFFIFNIPASMTVISSKAFEKSKIADINIPNTVEVIDEKAFYGVHTNSIHIPGSVKVIKTKAFGKAQIRYGIELDEGIEYIGNRAFADASILSFKKDIIIPDSCKFCHSHAFFVEWLCGVRVSYPAHLPLPNEEVSYIENTDDEYYYHRKTKDIDKNNAIVTNTITNKSGVIIGYTLRFNNGEEKDLQVKDVKILVDSGKIRIDWGNFTKI